jgi:hypothetical protein
MLKLDQHFFREFVVRMRMAHKYELRQVKSRYLREARRIVDDEAKRL